jgi:hypothetical protein
MVMRKWYWLAVLILPWAPPPAVAEHANIDLSVSRLDATSGAVKAEVSSTADAEPPAGGHVPRPLLKVKAGEPLVLQFFFTNTYPHGDLKGATVSYFIVREDRPRQSNLPDRSRGVITQGRFTLNFKPKAKAGARVHFTVTTPGFYLVRVQSGNTQSDHEHFSALDLQVE